LRYRKAIFAEAGGNGGALSGNFDIRLRSGRNDGPGVRIGLGHGGEYTAADGSFGNYVTVPLAYNHIFRNERSGIETGAGVTPFVTFNDPEDESNVRLNAFYNLGYRLQPLREGLLLRVVWTPSYSARDKFSSWAGVSVGYSFR
jgi:hypothetical protein